MTDSIDTEKYPVDVGEVLEELKTHAATVPSSTEPSRRKVLVLYTGGTFGSKEVDGKLSPMPPDEMFALLKTYPQLKDLCLHTDPNPPDSARIFFGAVLDDSGRTIDSTNATPQTWLKIAVAIERARNQYQGFVVIQGTDTLYYTGAALSFMLAGLLRTVVVTGSQTPLKSPVINDAIMNLLGSIGACLDDPSARFKLAGANSGGLPSELLGVFVYFDFRLMLGSRCMKLDSKNYRAFTSPNLGVIGVAQPNVVAPQYALVYDVTTVAKLNKLQRQVHDRLRRFAEAGLPRDWDIHNHLDDVCDPAVGVLPLVYNRKHKNWVSGPTKRSNVKIFFLRLAPGIQSLMVDAFCDFHADYDGVIVESYGAGNAPDAVIKALERLRTQHNLASTVITECNHSGVNSDYAVSVPETAGVLCHDMTPGAVYTRLYTTLAMLEWLYPGPGNKQVRRDRAEQVMKQPFLMCFTPPDDVESQSRVVAMAC